MLRCNLDVTASQNQTADPPGETAARSGGELHCVAWRVSHGKIEEVLLVIPYDDFTALTCRICSAHAPRDPPFLLQVSDPLQVAFVPPAFGPAVALLSTAKTLQEVT